jgi:hypothetical protein
MKVKDYVKSRLRRKLIFVDLFSNFAPLLLKMSLEKMCIQIVFFESSFWDWFLLKWTFVYNYFAMTTTQTDKRKWEREKEQLKHYNCKPSNFNTKIHNNTKKHIFGKNINQDEITLNECMSLN